MPEDSELRNFFLGYCRLVGGVVDEPAYGITEVLLPDETARHLGVAPYLRLSFEERSTQDSPAKEVVHQPLFLHYGHPLVEGIVEEVRQRAANARLYINAVRLEKPGLLELAGKTLAFPNARLFAASNAVEGRFIFHYACFNFKTSLMTDEKHELILPVWMYLQGGYAIDGQEIARLAPFESANQFKSIPTAAPVWKPGAQALSVDIFTGLLERAQRSALESLSVGPLKILLTHSKRHLELDQARLTQYYAELRQDLEKRLKNAAEERRASLQAKLEAVDLERQTKLIDAQAKYRPRVALELINWMIVSQPKVSLPVEIRKRSVSTTRQAIWDPLLHRLEPLVCDVCGQPSYNLSLCENGHLAHTDCLQPQCVECKRTFCNLCHDQLTTCVVCDRPVCLPSLTRCPVCGRGTCREHAGLCHANAGQPARLVAVQPIEEAQPAAIAGGILPADAEHIPIHPPQGKTPEQKTQDDRKKPVRTKEKEKAAAHRPRPVERSLVKGQQLIVYSEMSQPVISAYVVAGRRNLAIRVWELTNDGIHVSCTCEKGWRCPANGTLMRPESIDKIDTQLWGEILQLRLEYRVSPEKVNIYRIVRDQPQHERKLMLFGKWKDKEALAQTQEGYDNHQS